MRRALAADDHDNELVPPRPDVLEYWCGRPCTSRRSCARHRGQQPPRLAVATPQPGLPFDDLYNSTGEISRGLRYYHENGQILALERHILPCNGYCERWLNLYDEQGQPLYAEHFRKDGDLGSFRRWRAPEYRPAAGQEKTFLASQSATHREDRSLVYLAASIRYNTLRKMLQYEGL